MRVSGVSERDAGRRRAALLAAVACAALALWAWLGHGRASWSLPIAALWFGWRALRRPAARGPSPTTRT